MDFRGPATYQKPKGQDALENILNDINNDVVGLNILRYRLDTLLNEVKNMDLSKYRRQDNINLMTTIVDKLGRVIMDLREHESTLIEELQMLKNNN